MENFILNHRGLSIRAGLCCLVSERNMVVSNGVIYSMESIIRLLKFRRIQHLLQCGDFIVELGAWLAESQEISAAAYRYSKKDTAPKSNWAEPTSRRGQTMHPQAGLG